MSDMTTEAAAKLRAPFKPTEIGKLPKISCTPCSKTQGTKVCGDHKKSRCRVCGNWITEQHIHLDYVGHAEITDRLLQVDPEWSWEPVATDANGLPKFDDEGGLWIRLTVAGVTRLGYGDAEGKKGPSAKKETIGDALRNAAMRFGVGLDLWGAKFDPPGDGDDSAGAADDTPAVDIKAIRDEAVKADTAVQRIRALYAEAKPALTTMVINEHGDDEQLGDLLIRIGKERQATAEAQADVAAHDESMDDSGPAITGPKMATDKQHKRMHVLWAKIGFEKNRDRRIAATSRMIKRPITTSKELTFAEAEIVIAGLEEKEKADAAAAKAETTERRELAEASA